MKLLAAAAAILLPGCASTASLEWSVAEPGCYERGIADAFQAPEDIGRTDIRAGRLPDTGQGPGLMVQFRRYIDEVYGRSEGPPDLVVAVGGWQKSCVVVIELSACPQAEAAYSSLASASIPLNHAFDRPEGVTLLHGTRYFLSTRDGEDNQIDWSYYGSGNPLQRKVSDALDDLATCAVTAVEAYRRAGSD